MKIKTNNRFTPRPVTQNLVVQEINDEILIYNLVTNRAFCLNRTAALVWQSCDGATTVGEISRIVGEKNRATADENLIWLALDSLVKNGLIAEDEGLRAGFSGVSRRALIKNVGLGSLVALPLIYTLAAPTAAQAQSGARCANPALTSCRTGTDCLNSVSGGACSNNCCVPDAPIEGCVGPGCPPEPPGCDPIFGC